MLMAETVQVSAVLEVQQRTDPQEEFFGLVQRLVEAAEDALATAVLAGAAAAPALDGAPPLPPSIDCSRFSRADATRSAMSFWSSFLDRSAAIGRAGAASLLPAALPAAASSAASTRA